MEPKSIFHTVGLYDLGKMKRRARDAEGKATGTANDVPILDTESYKVEFPDQDIAEYSANVIAENVYMQCDPAGNKLQLLMEQMDHMADGRATKNDANRFRIVNGRQHYRKTTIGWEL